MNFIMITCLVMLLSVFIIYKITNFFGFRLKLKSLLLCAACAFSVNFITLSISSYLTTSHFVLILAAVFLSACLVTYYNDRSSHPAAVAGNCSSPPLAVMTAAVTEHSAPEPVESQSPAAVTAPEREEPNRPAAVLTPGSVPAPVAETGKRFFPPAKIQEDIAAIVKKDMENDRLLKLTAALAKLNSLDAILDYAYEQKSRKNYPNALFAFKQALHRYESDAYAPFIVIELGNIYKDTGAYEEAIAVYTNALDLSVIASDRSTNEKFAATISYLRIVRHVLNKHNSSKLPFYQIPRSYMQEIEFTFQNWSAKKHAS